MDSLAPRTRVLLAVLGVMLILLSLLALSYAFGGTERVREQEVPEPTWFVPPQSQFEGWHTG
jgi:hypothetical protein